MHLFGKKYSVLTATLCTKFENLRAAIEVLSGKPTRLVQMDFNTGKGKVSIGFEENVLFYMDSNREDLFHFSIGESYCFRWDKAYTARFDTPGVVRVISERDPLKFGDWQMWVVGTSSNHRWVEPLYIEAANNAARLKGHDSWKEFLDIPDTFAF